MPTVLEAALNLLETKGWIKGRLNSGYGYCALGAVQAVCWNRNYSPGIPLIHLRDAIGDTNISIAQWNDAPERTKEDVIAAFRKAIEYERGII